MLTERGWRRLQPDTDADQVCCLAHDRWLTAAERACDEAMQRRTVYPTDSTWRVCYVGKGGVTVYAATAGDQRVLVTAFRPVPRYLAGRIDASKIDEAALDRAERKSGVIDRTAVRRAMWRASLPGERTGDALRTGGGD